MSVNDSMLDSDSTLADLPTFDLDYTVDDGEEPAWITVYVDGGEQFATNWITIDADHAVDLVHVA